MLAEIPNRWKKIGLFLHSRVTKSSDKHKTEGHFNAQSSNSAQIEADQEVH